MPVECSKCRKIVEPIFRTDEGLECHVCPECGNVIDGCTNNIQVMGRDM